MRENKTIDSLRYFRKGSWIEEPRTLIAGDPVPLRSESPLAKIPGLARFYRFVFPFYLGARLRGMEDHLFHSPNFYLPPFSGKKITTIHDLSVIRHPEFHPPARIAHLRNEIPRALDRTDFVITDSEFVRQEVIEEFGWDPDLIRAIPLAANRGFTPRPYHELERPLRKLGLKPGQYCLCAATLEPRKNIDLLLDAYIGLPEPLRKQYPLVVVGHPGWQSSQLHARIKSLADSNWLRYIGYVSDQELQALYAGTRAFAYPSLYEGFGLPVLEAMQCGVPVVTTNASSIPEVCGEAGLLVQPGDTRALRDVLEQAITDESWRKKEETRSQMNARRFSWEQTVEQTIEVYGYVMGLR